MPLSDYSEDEIIAEAFRIMRNRQPVAPKPKKLSACPKCGDLYGVAEMRVHKPKCKGKQP